MKQVIGMLLFLLIVGQAFAASQVPDICIIKNDKTQDTLSVFVFPLEDYFELKGDRDLGGFKYCESNSCTRGYQAVWLIENDSLFLVNIQGCNKQMSWCDESSMPNLKTMFGDACVNNKVFANWVNGNYRFLEGNEIPIIDKQIFNAEYQVAINQGKVKKIKRKINVSCDKKSIEINEKTPEFILNTIGERFYWTNMPVMLKQKWYAEMEITVLKNKKTIIKLITDTSEEFRLAAEQEFIRCLDKIRWCKYKQMGKKLEITFVVRAYFERNTKTITIIK